MKHTKQINFSTIWDSDYWMSSNGMSCGFNMPDVLISNGEGAKEIAHGLPPYAKRKFYLSDEYPACPKNWVPSEGRKTSYFVPVQEDKGMWLDFNKNSQHKYEVAIVISVQGINPITGMPCHDAGLEQYIDTCPKHDIKFGPHRYCEKCGYKWPKQNYICTTGTPNGSLWLDGFRAADGVVRQYVLTMDKIKGVASNIIGNDRVFAVGISFFLSNNPKPVIQQRTLSRPGNVLYSMKCSGSLGAAKQHCRDCKGGGSSAGGMSAGGMSAGGWQNRVGDCFKSFDETPDSNINYSADIVSFAAPGAAGAAAPSGLDDSRSISDSDDSGDSDNLVESPDLVCGDWNRKAYIPIQKASESGAMHVNSTSGVPRSVSVKKVEIGKGASIQQQVYDDPEPLDFWRKEPESLILINYCLENDARKIIEGGKISLEGHKESFLKDIPNSNEVKKELVEKE